MLSEINRTRNGGQAVHILFFPLCLFKNQTIILTVKLHPNSVLRTVGPINGANDLVVAQTGGKIKGLYIALALQKGYRWSNSLLKAFGIVQIT